MSALRDRRPLAPLFELKHNTPCARCGHRFDRHITEPDREINYLTCADCEACEGFALIDGEARAAALQQERDHFEKLLIAEETANAELYEAHKAAEAALGERSVQLAKMQTHRDHWRGYAYGLRAKPQDFLDGNMVNPRMMTFLEINGQLLDERTKQLTAAEAAIVSLQAEHEAMRRLYEWDKAVVDALVDDDAGEALRSLQKRLSDLQVQLQAITQEMRANRDYPVSILEPWADRLAALEKEKE